MSKICCFTGHRDISDELYAPTMKKLRAYVEHLICNEGFTDFRSGGAIGFDTIAALTVLELREKYPHIKLHLFLPHKNQEQYFGEQSKRIYRAILEKADSAIFVSEHYHRGVMHKRNRALVNGSQLCIAYVRRVSGGSYYTAKYAKDKGIRVVNLLKIKDI